MKYKIEVSVRDASKALEIIRDNPFLKKKINEEASNSYSTTSQESAEELHESLIRAGVEILSSNVYAGNGAKINDLEQWWYSLAESTREYLFMDNRDTSWDVYASDRVWEGLSESKKTEIRTAIERNPGDEISVKYALDLPGKYRSGYYLEKEIIQNQYDGKTPEQVWNAWTQVQKKHFLSDHMPYSGSANQKEMQEFLRGRAEFSSLKWDELDGHVKTIIEHHVSSGQYGKGGEVEGDDFQEAAEFLMDKTVLVYGLGQLEPTEHKIKGVHITPKHFNQRHLYFSFYGNEWPHNFNDYDRLTADQLGDFIAGEEVHLKDSQGEPYIVALGDIAGKGTKITMPIMEPGELTDVLYSKENNWADIGQAQIYVYQTPSVSDYLKRLHIIDLTGQSASKIKYTDGVYVFIAKVGNRYYYVNTEGYDYARYAVEIPGWFAREINMEKAAKGTKIENMDFETRFSKFIKELSWLSNKTGVVIGGHYNDALGEYIEYTNDWTSGDIWRGGKSRETTDAPKGYYRFIKGLEAISNKYGIEVHSTGHVITEHNGMVKYTDDPTSGDINYKELNGKGSKIKENMENKNYYYLKIGNRIIETFGGFSMTGSTKGGQYIYEIIGHNPTGIMVREHTITKSKKTEPFEISFYDLTKYMNAEAKGYQVEGCPMENMRDEALLDMEIADIKNSFKIAEEKAEVRKKEAEVSQAKHEADVLLKKATDTEAAAKDTIDAMALLTVKKNTEDAYMRDTYGNKAWEIAIKELGKLGFSKDQIEWILNSKYMRWASDEYRSPNGKLKGTEIIQFYNSHGFMDDDDKQIVPANAKAGKGTKIKEFGIKDVNRLSNQALREFEKETGNKLFKKEAKIGKYYHFRLNNPKGVQKCAVPSWASDLAGSVYEGAKITTCKKDGEWFAQNVMIPTKNISKLQARSYAQQIALKIKK